MAVLIILKAKMGVKVDPRWSNYVFSLTTFPMECQRLIYPRTSE